MSASKKIALGVFVFLFIVLVAVVIIVPLMFDLDRYRPQVVATIRQETGKPVQIGHLALTIFPRVSIRADDLALGNPAGFPKGNFVTARRIYAVVDAFALWDRKVVIHSLELSDPAITFLSDVRGKWNFENTSSAKDAADPKPGEKPLFSLGVISMLRITNGQLTAANVLSSGQPGPTFFEAHGVTSQLEQVDLNAFTQSAANGLVPSPPGAGSAFWAGWQGSIAYAAAPGPRLAAQGTLKADSLRFGALGVTALKSKLRLFPKQVFLDDLSFECYGGHATGDLWFNFAGQDLRYTSSARLQGVNVAQLLNAFPQARGKMTGTLDGSTKLNGEVTHSPDPLAGIRGTGQLSIRKGQLPSLQLNKNLLELARLANLGLASGDSSSFSSISTDFAIANQRITSNKITIIGNGVDVDGGGSLALAGVGSLDYQGVAKIAAAQNPLTNILADLSGAKYADGKLSLPFNLGGTLQSPKFTLKSLGGASQVGAVSGLLGGKAGQSTSTKKGQPQQPADVVQGITDLFKKKKQP